jgi:hypothetical protein
VFRGGHAGAGPGVGPGLLQTWVKGGSAAQRRDRGDDGQLGDGKSGRRRQSGKVGGKLGGVVDLSAFDISTRAVTAQGGSVQWWGQYEPGANGAETAAEPRPLLRLHDAAAAASRGNGEPCFVGRDTSATCLGSAAGDVYHLSGSKTGAALERITTVATGGFAHCAIAHGGELWCSRPRKHPRKPGRALRVWPVKVPVAKAGTKDEKPEILRGVTAVAVGAEHACALAGGQLWCWGKGTYGQLGVAEAAAPADGKTPIKVPIP